ncbi:MAG: hypothetical protein AAFO07_28555 [Bacteroidota bacterium]
MNRNYFFILLVSILTIGACNKQEAEDPDLSGPYIGSWDIQEVSGGFAGIGYQMAFKTISLTEDGRYISAKEDVFFETGNYLIYKKSGQDWIKFEDVLNLRDPFSTTEKRILLLEDGTLLMSDPCCDLYTYIFERVD